MTAFQIAFAWAIVATITLVSPHLSVREKKAMVPVLVGIAGAFWAAGRFLR